MRSLKISLTLFAMLIICIVFNSLYISRCADKLLSQADAILVSRSTEELDSFWKSNKKYIGMSISEIQLDNISRLIVCIHCDIEQKNYANLEKDVALLCEAADGIRKYEKLSIENLF